MKKYLLILLISTSALADDIPIGTLKYVIGGDYQKADGHCLKIKDFPELADVLHDGSRWPYGRCNKDGFKLPNTCDQNNNCAIIKVK